jgi:hypothetical protein
MAEVTSIKTAKGAVRRGKDAKATSGTKRAAKVAKAVKDRSGPCACECGGVAKNGGFIPGHDSKLTGALKRVNGGRPYEGERAYVDKIKKSEHPALNSDHFRKLLGR